jgi:hypothetical protein
LSGFVQWGKDCMDGPGEIVAIIPNVTWAPKTQVDFLLIVEKLG